MVATDIETTTFTTELEPRVREKTIAYDPGLPESTRQMGIEQVQGPTDDCSSDSDTSTSFDVAEDSSLNMHISTSCYRYYLPSRPRLFLDLSFLQDPATEKPYEVAQEIRESQISIPNPSHELLATKSSQGSELHPLSACLLDVATKKSSEDTHGDDTRCESQVSIPPSHERAMKWSQEVIPPPPPPPPPRPAILPDTAADKSSEHSQGDTKCASQVSKKPSHELAPKSSQESESPPPSAFLPVTAAEESFEATQEDTVCESRVSTPNPSHERAIKWRQEPIPPPPSAFLPGAATEKSSFEHTQSESQISIPQQKKNPMHELATRLSQKPYIPPSPNPDLPPLPPFPTDEELTREWSSPEGRATKFAIRTNGLARLLDPNSYLPVWKRFPERESEEKRKLRETIEKFIESRRENPILDYKGSCGVVG